MEGFTGTKADEFKDTANTLNVLKVLQYEKADVLLMQKLYCCGMEIAQQAGYPHSVEQVPIYRYTEYPIDSIKIFKPFNAHYGSIDVDEPAIVVNPGYYLPDSLKALKN